MTHGSSEVRVVAKSQENKEFLMSPEAPEPVGAYPHARKAGSLLFLSGVGPRKKGSVDIPGVTLNNQGHVVEKDITLQTKSVIANVQAILESSGSSLEKVVDIQVFLTDMKNDFKIFNKVYAEYFSSIGPTRTTIEVLSLPTSIAVEFKVIATL